MLFDVIGWAIIGLVVGWYASKLVGQASYTGQGIQGDFGFALMGAIIGGVLARILSVGGPAASNVFTWPSLIFAAIGTVITLSLVRAMSVVGSR